MIKKLFNNDNFLRALSIVVAVFLWMYIVSLNNPQVEIPITGVDIEVINTQNIDENKLDIISVSDTKTTVKIFGRMSEVSGITANDIKVYIDASEIYSANNYYLDTHSEIDSNSVVVSGIDTKTVTIYVDYIQAIEKNIEVLVVGEPKNGFALKEAIPAFDKVVIKGPESMLNKVSNVKATLDITNANSDYSTVCPVKLYTANGEVIASDFLTTTVTDVSVEVKFNNSKNIPLELLLPEGINAEQYDIKLSPSAVDVVGNVELLNQLEKITLSLNEETDISTNNKFDIALPLIEGIEYLGGVNTISVELIEK